MVYKDIEFEPISSNPFCIQFPVEKINDHMYVTIDAAMSDRWYELNSSCGIEEGINLEQITDVRAYLMLQTSRNSPRIGYKVEIKTSTGVTVTKKVRMDESPQAVAELLDSFFAMGAPGLAPDVYTTLYQQHKFYRKKYGNNPADKIIELLEQGYTVDQVISYMEQ